MQHICDHAKLCDMRWGPPKLCMLMQELGGNAACVIEDFREGELEAMVPKLTFGAFYQSGQSCISVQRCLIRQVRAPRLALVSSVLQSFQSGQSCSSCSCAAVHTWAAVLQ